MLTVADQLRIRQAYYHEKKSQRAIAREWGLSRNTVKKALEQDEPFAYRRQHALEMRLHVVELEMALQGDVAPVFGLEGVAVLAGDEHPGKAPQHAAVQFRRWSLFPASHKPIIQKWRSILSGMSWQAQPV